MLTDPNEFPFEDESVDIVVSSSCLTHSEVFWLVFLEVMRILRPDGLFHLNVPSTGNFHRDLVDCFPHRIVDIKTDLENVRRLGSGELAEVVETSQNERRLHAIRQIVAAEIPPAS